jgi:hypothetical protein
MSVLLANTSLLKYGFRKKEPKLASSVIVPKPTPENLVGVAVPAMAIFLNRIVLSASYIL